MFPRFNMVREQKTINSYRMYDTAAQIRPSCGSSQVSNVDIKKSLIKLM